MISFQSFGQSEAYNWRSVAIGGGGFVSGIITSKTQSGLIYARTDVGGAYRWDNANSRWIPLTDWVSEDEVGYLGVESIALDPSSSNRVYMLVGISYFNNGKTAILRSTDNGNTFSIVDVTSQFTAHGNGMGRQNGERLVVDPNNGNILYCGTRWHGMFKSTDAGVTWSRLSGLDVTTTTNENGVCFVVADGSSASGGASQRIFAGISRTGSNFYRSNNGGQTFTAVTGGPTTLMPQRAVLSGDGNLYITYANGSGPHAKESISEPMNTGQIWKYNISSGAWTNVTPSGVTFPFGGISVDPQNANRLIASTTNAWPKQGTRDGDRFYLTTNGGASWIDVVERGFSMDTNGVPWSGAIHWAGSIEFDPFNTQRVFVTSGNGLFVNENINATAGVWKTAVNGLEETVPLGLVSIPGGPVVSVVGDYDGFVHTNPSQYAPMHSPSMGTTSGLAYGGNKLLRVGNAMYYSTNQGTSWTQCSINGSYGKVAISSDGNTFLHSPQQSSTTYRSTNNGSTWTTVSGLGISEAYPTADPANANKFYAYDPSNGAIFVSTNGGSSFSQAGSTGTKGSKIIRLAPGREGHLWVPLNDGGLSRSTNSGQSFSTVSGVTTCGAIGFGKEASGSSYPTIYVWGTVNGVKGVHRSTNEGASWVRVNDDAHEYGGPGNGHFVQGDMNVFGRVYMSTAGRGIVYGDPATCTPTTITPYMQVGGTWTQTSSATVAAGATVILGPQPTSGGSWSWSGMASGTSREVTLTPTSSGTATATYTNASGCQSTQVFTITVSGGSSFVTIANRATGLLIDGMGRTSAGSACGQYASSGSWNQMWTLETSGAYVYIKNRNTGLYIDGRGNTTNGAFAGQWTSSTSNNLQWQQETVGSYVKFKNRATGQYLDGMGNTTNGADLGQWASSTSNNQQWTVTTVTSGGRLSTEQTEEALTAYPNPVTGRITITLPVEMKAAAITVISASGNVLIREKASGSTHVLDMAHLPTGLYLIRANDGVKNKILKVIKQ